MVDNRLEYLLMIILIILLTTDQMVFFIGFATEWSATSNYLQHAWITWATRGLCKYVRQDREHWLIMSQIPVSAAPTSATKVSLKSNILYAIRLIISIVDDMFLISDIYRPAGRTYRITTADMDQHKTWTADIQSRLPAGSKYFLDIGHNGNGNIEAGADLGGTQCGIGPIEYDEQIDTPLEFMKPLGTGKNLWPSTPATYPYTTTCTNLDPLKVWFAKAANRDVFAHVSHTFTHEDQNNATYFDVSRELSWNQAWLKQVGIAAGNKFSPNGIIPPAITGMHNGDAIKAWLDNGIKYVVGDNTRPVLMNKENEFWPLISTVADNGYAGATIVPRWATNIYYNVCTPLSHLQVILTQ